MKVIHNFISNAKSAVPRMQNINNMKTNITGIKICYLTIYQKPGKFFDTFLIKFESNLKIFKIFKDHRFTCKFRKRDHLLVNT